MKSSGQVLGLPVLSIEEGKYIGRVKRLVVNPQQGRVDFILVEDGTWYMGLKAIAFKDILGIGESALTVTGRQSLLAVTECAGALSLMEKNICIAGLKILSKKGRLVGAVGDYFINDSTGDITGCQLLPVGGEKPVGIIPRQQILTYGLEFLVVEEDAEEKIIPELDEHNVNLAWKNKQIDTNDTPGETVDEIQPADALRHFEEQQRQYLLGKKVAMRIIADNGEVIAEEGETITDEIIELARAADKYIDLTMNIRE